MRLLACLAAFTLIQECVVIATQMKCEPGSVRSTEKGDDCTPCPLGTYMSEYNRELSCHECSRCILWPRNVTECNATHDRECGCYDGYDKKPDGCVKKTVDGNPLWNCTASVDRIEQYLRGLHMSLNGTHEDSISQIFRELRNLNHTLTHATQQVPSDSALVLSTSQTHETIFKDGRTEKWFYISVAVFLCVQAIIALTWEFGKEALYHFFRRIRKCLKTCHSGYSLVNSEGYIPVDIKVLKDVMQIKHAVCGDYEDEDSSENSLQQMMKKLTRLTNRTELEVRARAVNEALFGEDSTQEISGSIQEMIAKIITPENAQDHLPNKEKIIDTAKNIQKKIFGNGNSEENRIEESSMKSIIKEVFKEARDAFHGMFSQKAAKMQRKVNISMEVQGSQADSKCLKIMPTLAKLSSCREVKIVEATKRLLQKLGESVPACDYFNKKARDLLNILEKHAQESVRQEAQKIKAALTAEIIEDRAIEGLQSKYKRFSVKRLVRELVSCSNGLPFRSSITELEHHLFGKRSIRHMLSSLVFDEQQQETALCRSHIESALVRWQTAIDGSKAAEQEVTARQAELMNALSKVEQKISGFESWQSQISEDLQGIKQISSDRQNTNGEESKPPTEATPLFDTQGITLKLTKLQEGVVGIETAIKDVLSSMSDIEKALPWNKQNSGGVAPGVSGIVAAANENEPSREGIVSGLSGIKNRLSDYQKKLEGLEKGQSQILKALNGSAINPGEIMHHLSDIKECLLKWERKPAGTTASSLVQANDECDNASGQPRAEDTIINPR